MAGAQHADVACTMYLPAGPSYPCLDAAPASSYPCDPRVAARHRPEVKDRKHSGKVGAWSWRVNSGPAATDPTAGGLNTFFRMKGGTAEVDLGQASQVNVSLPF